MPAGPNRTRLDVLLSDEEMRNFRVAAKGAKMSLSSYGKGIIVRSMSEPSPEHREMVNRVALLEEAIAELKASFETQSEKLIRLTMAALASSAMLRDDGNGTNEEASQKILSHIAESIAASPGILKIHEKSLN